MFFLNRIKYLISKPKNPMNNKFSKEELQKRLTAEQYRVTQENGTEPPYKSNPGLT